MKSFGYWSEVAVYAGCVVVFVWLGLTEEGLGMRLLFAALALVSIALLWFELAPLRGATAGAASANPASATAPRSTVAAMAEDRFWSIVGASTARESDPDAQLEALHAELGKLTPVELEAYESRFAELLRRTYRWDLWGAAYVAQGGASDDGFEYFRCWLISKGRAVFDAVAANPDHLAEIAGTPGASLGVDGVLEFEAFAYAAREAWARKTGRDGGEMPTAADMIYVGATPAGAHWDEAELPARFPKLWAKFGEHPLG